MKIFHEPATNGTRVREHESSPLRESQAFEHVRLLGWCRIRVLEAGEGLVEELAVRVHDEVVRALAGRSQRRASATRVPRTSDGQQVGRVEQAVDLAEEVVAELVEDAGDGRRVDWRLGARLAAAAGLLDRPVDVEVVVAL